MCEAYHSLGSQSALHQIPDGDGSDEGRLRHTHTQSERDTHTHTLLKGLSERASITHQTRRLCLLLVRSVSEDTDGGHRERRLHTSHNDETGGIFTLTLDKTTLRSEQGRLMTSFQQARNNQTFIADSNKHHHISTPLTSLPINVTSRAH